MAHPVAARDPAGVTGSRRRLGALLLGMSALTGCIDFDLARAVVFPPGIPGLPADQPWLFLPVDAWETEGDVKPVAIAACFTACAVPAAVGLFRATGNTRATLARDAAAPARLLPSPARPGGRNAAARAVATSDPVRFGRLSGTALAFAKPDGTRPVTGIALASPAGDLALVIVSPDPAGARAIARSIAQSVE